MISMVRRSDSSRFLGARGSMPGKTTDARRPSGLGMYSGGGEYGALVGLEVRLEEVPRHARRGVLRVEPDMAAPDREQRHGSTQLARHRERLWVVNHQDVTGADQLSQALRVRPVHGLVEYPVGLAELRHAFAVNQVVDPLGELEEPGIVAADDHPFDLHSQAAEQRQTVGSISATPPPFAVELTIQTVRPASFGTTPWASRFSSATAGARWATAA
jgi:hypothetical protein